MSALAITSPQCLHGGPLPENAGAALGNQAPLLDTSGVPEGAMELALVLHDPDAPRPEGFTHWLVYGISPDTARLDSQNLAPCRQGENDAGTMDYFGPRPPRGHGLHHYYFTVYALDCEVEGEPSRRQFLDRYARNVLEQNRIVGTFMTA